MHRFVQPTTLVGLCYKRPLLTALILLVVSVVHSQTIRRQLTGADGLPGSSVNCIAEDRSHCLWIGTWDGLCTFDGRTVVTFEYSRNGASLPNNIVRQVVETSDSIVWIATDGGVARWSRCSERFRRYYPGQTDRRLAHDSNAYELGIVNGGTLLCFVLNGGLYVFSEDADDFVPVGGFDTRGCYHFTTDGDGLVYMKATDGRLVCGRLDGQSGGYRLQPIPLSLPFAPDCFLPVANGLYLSDSHHLYYYKKDRQLLTLAVLPDNCHVRAMALRGDRLVVGYREGGCEEVDPSAGRRRVLIPPGQGASVFSIFAGSQDILWVGTDGQGLLQLYDNGIGFHAYKLPFPVRCFAEDGTGGTLVGTKGGGILRLTSDRRLLPCFTSHNGLPSNAVYALGRNAQGDLFAGTDGDGLFCIPRNGGHPYVVNLPQSGIRSVYSIAFCPGDTVAWLGSYGQGLMRLSLRKTGERWAVKTVRRWTTASTPSLPSNIVFAVVPTDHSNRVLLGMRGGGFCLFDAATGESIPQATDGLTSENVTCLLPATDGAIWVGTTYGLTRLSGGSVKHDFPLLSSTVHALVDDGQGHIWVSTNRGLTRLQGEVLHFTAKSGLHGDEFADGAAFRAADGTLFFGGVDGFTFFHPDSIRVRHHEASLTLRKLDINNTSQPVVQRTRGGKLILDYDERYVKLTFSIAEFINNDDCQLKYRLRGYADEWIDNSSSLTVQLMRLPQGRYTLEVCCTNGDRQWSDYPYELTIIVRGPWWSSWWAILLYIATTVLVVYTIVTLRRYRQRMERMQRLIKELQQPAPIIRQPEDMETCESPEYSELTDNPDYSEGTVNVEDLEPSPSPWLKRLVAFVEANIDDDELSPEQLAAHMGMSRTAFYTRLKQLTGRTPGETVKTIRLEHAAHLIATTRLNINEVMYKSGFVSKSHFYAAFSQRYQCPPSDYRKKKTSHSH